VQGRDFGDPVSKKGALFPHTLCSPLAPQAIFPFFFLTPARPHQLPRVSQSIAAHSSQPAAPLSKPRFSLNADLAEGEVLEAAAPAPSQAEQDVAALVAMGYAEQAAKDALQERGGNLQEAALYLSGEASKPKAPKYSSEPLETPCMAVTSPVTGERVYIPLNLPDARDAWCAAPKGVGDSNALLARPMGELIRAIDEKRMARAMSESAEAPVVSEPSLTKFELKERKEAKKKGVDKLWADK
jgi:hypothetical protein